MSLQADRQPAVLLVGPTGAGKTPLGDYLAANGLWAHRCAHLDFGAELRALAGGRETSLNGDDLDTVRSALTGNALLENENFHIAETIVRDFIRRSRLTGADYLLLNGLPRHVGQARDMHALVRMTGVIRLDCAAPTVAARIRRNSGGDRTGRIDDSGAEVERKLAIFHERTLPLLDHYRGEGVSIYVLPVSVNTTPRALAAALQEMQHGH